MLNLENKICVIKHETNTLYWLYHKSYDFDLNKFSSENDSENEVIRSNVILGKNDIHLFFVSGQQKWDKKQLFNETKIYDVYNIYSFKFEKKYCLFIEETNNTIKELT